MYRISTLPIVFRFMVFAASVAVPQLVHGGGEEVLDWEHVAWEDLKAGTGDLLIEGFPLTVDTKIDLLVAPFSVIGRETRFVVGDRRHEDRSLDFDPSTISLFRGQVSDDPASRVLLTVSQSSLKGHIEYLGRHYRLSVPVSADGLIEPGATRVVPETTAAGFVPPVPVCGVDFVPSQVVARGGPDEPVPTLGMRTIELGVDTDYDLFEIFGDLDATAAYVIELYGAVSDIYMRDVNARMELTFVRLWDTPDDLYNQPDPLGPFQNEWNANMGDVTRDVAQLLTGRRDLPYGGVAYLSSLCGSSAYSVAGFITGSFVTIEGVSNGNWDAIVTAHELGHNCGTGHTHDSYSPPIDQCGLGVLSRGTIMSYCHIEPGGIGNIDMHMHSQVEAVMRDFIGGSECVAEDCNANNVDDGIDLTSGTSLDVNGNGIPDECEDCNKNGILDDIEISSGDSNDVNSNKLPDECEADCNANGTPDTFDIYLRDSDDADGDNLPDECEEDCDTNGVADWVEVNADMALDIDRNVVLDSCQDCDGDGILDSEALAGAYNLWVAGNGGTTITQYHAVSGVLALTSEDDHVAGAQGLIIDETGRVLVASSADNRVAVFDGVSGAYVSDLISSGSGGLSVPAALLLTPSGTLLVSSRTTDSVLEFDGLTGTFLGEFVTPSLGGLDSPFGLTLGTNENLFVASGGTQEVIQYDGISGDLIGTFVAAGSGGLTGPRGLLFLNTGNLLVASFNTNSILEYDGITGAFIRQFNESGQEGAAYWSLDRPRALRLGPNGQVYAAASQAFAGIQMFDAITGKFQRSFYVLAENGPVTPTGFDFMPGQDVDCNVNILPDVCDIAAGTSTDDNDNGVPDECEALPPPSCEGDANGDGTVDPLDAGFVLARLGCPVGTGDPDCDAADANADGVVDPLDVGYVLARFGPCR